MTPITPYQSRSTLSITLSITDTSSNTWRTCDAIQTLTCSLSHTMWLTYDAIYIPPINTFTFCISMSFKP